MLSISLPVALLIGLALLSDFLNGFRDGSSLVATAIATRALSSRHALVLTALAEFVGPFAFGVTVASTFGNQLVVSSKLKISVILAALLAGIVWNIVTWMAGLSSSSSHALVGGLIGAALAENNWATIQTTGLYRVLVSLAVSPVIGLLAGYLAMKMILFLARSDAAHQWVFQAQPSSDGAWIGAVIRGQRWTKDYGRHHVGIGRRPRAACLSSSPI